MNRTVTERKGWEEKKKKKKSEKEASGGEGRLKGHMKESLLACESTSAGWFCHGTASVSVCVHVGMFACMHRSAAAKQRLLYIKAGSWLCPELRSL